MANAREKFDMIAEYFERTQPEVKRDNVYRKPGMTFEGAPFGVLFRDGLAVRIHGRALTQAMTLPGARPFDPLAPDKPPPGVPGWVWLPPSQMLRWDRLVTDALRCQREAREGRVSWSLPAPPPTPTDAPPPSSADSLGQRVKKFFAGDWLSKFKIG
jgi:hypothetical protein